MKLSIPIEVDFDDLKSLLDDLGKLQKYKLFEGDKMVLVDVNDVADVLVKHIKAKEKQPELTGHWVEIGDEPYDEWECDRCGFVIDGSGCIDPEEYRDIYIFCPHCGSMMLKEGDTE